MAEVFKIKNENDKLTAETGSATTVFKVTNTTSRPLRGFATINPLGNTESAWLKIEGEVERDFPAGESHDFTVIFTKPKPPNFTASGGNIPVSIGCEFVGKPGRRFHQRTDCNGRDTRTKRRKEKVPVVDSGNCGGNFADRCRRCSVSGFAKRRQRCFSSRCY